MINRDELLKQTKAPFVGWFGLIWIVGFLCICASPFIWIWGDFDTAWKFALSGFVAILVVSLIWIPVKKQIQKSVDEFLEKEKKNPLKKVSKFQQRLEEAMENSRKVRDN